MVKTFVLIVSERFPKTHKKAGENTGFPEAISAGLKIHTIRSNYKFWKKRVKKINSGEAVLSLRVWSGNPYNSKQKEIAVFTQIGIEKIKYLRPSFYIDGKKLNVEKLAKNDGLSSEDFYEWIGKYPDSDMAILHFSNFRYEK